MIISLIGYMGSGKSRIAKCLQEQTKFNLIDLDVLISKKNNSAITEIFKQKGEIFFRRLERETLEEVLATEENCIVSLGGGTPCYYNNIEVINNASLSVYLRARIPTLAERLRLQKNKRPLIANISDEDLPEFIAKHLFERNKFYSQAKFTVDTDEKTPEEISEEIIHLPGFPG